VSILSNSPGARKSHILCYVTDRRSLSSPAPSGVSSALLQKIATIALAGVHWVQIREKDLSARELTKLTRDALRSTAQRPDSTSSATRILVNDRVDVALAERADGVHLGENGLPVDEVKRLIESRRSLRVTQAPLPEPAKPAASDFLLGVSCHSLEGAKSVAASGASYIFFGPVFATPSKAAFGRPQGVERLAEVCHAVRLPVLAIGGITLENAEACFAAGASGIAAIRLFQDSRDPAATVAALYPY
jgi:thiamine-phosphate pyrophosphorylase